MLLLRAVGPCTYAGKIKSRNADDILSSLKTGKADAKKLLAIVRKNSGGEKSISSPRHGAAGKATLSRARAPSGAGQQGGGGGGEAWPGEAMAMLA